MVALRSLGSRASEDADPPLPRPDPADWLTLQQAACELNVSISTVRRLIRKGKLRNRIVPRRGGFAYLIYLPGSRHADGLHDHGRPVERARHLEVVQEPAAPGDDEERDDEIRRLEAQVHNLSEALSRVLRIRQTALPQGFGAADAAQPDPYARYRWLVRRQRRWWPF